jgi:uncharacterized protein (DUF1330 family)
MGNRVIPSEGGGIVKMWGRDVCAIPGKRFPDFLPIPRRLPPVWCILSEFHESAGAFVPGDPRLNRKEPFPMSPTAIRRFMLILSLLALGLTLGPGDPAFAQGSDDPTSQPAGETAALKAAWELAPQGLDADLKKMNEQWNAIEAQLGDAAHIKIRAGKISNWSVGQQCLHILKVANAIGGQYALLLENPAPEGAAAKPGMPMKAQALAGGFPRGVAQAPRGLGVHYQPDLEEIRTTLAKTREIWQVAIDRKDEIGAATATFPHPVFGPMNAPEWLRFTTVHTSHHLKIVDDILADNEARMSDAGSSSGTAVTASSAGASASAADSNTAAAESKPGPPVFAVALLDIQNRTEYSKYEMGFLPIIAKYGGQVLAVDENVFALEGEWPWQRTVILRFPDRASLDRWYTSAEYQAILPHRLASSKAQIAIVKGFGTGGI